MREVVRGFRVVAWREVLRLFAQKPRLVASIATPLLFFALFGAGFNRLVGQIAPGVDLVTFMFPGIVAMTVIMPAVFTGMSVVWDREFGFLREVLVAPVSRTGIALGKVGGGATVATAEGLVILLLGPLVGVALSPGRVAGALVLMFLLAVLLSAFGILLGARIRSQEVFQTVMALVVFPILFLSGVFFPVAATPGWLSVLAKLNPATYGVDAIRQVLLGGRGAGAVSGSGPAGADSLATGLVSGAAEVDPALTGITVAGHVMTIPEEAAIMLVLAIALVWAGSRAFRWEE